MKENGVLLYNVYHRKFCSLGSPTIAAVEWKRKHQMEKGDITENSTNHKSYDVKI
jgi:hypothetical protein